MNKSQFIHQMAEETQSSKTKAEDFLNALTDLVKERLCQGGEVRLLRFGTFLNQVRGARTGRNPKTGNSILIPEKRVPCFKAGHELKAVVNATAPLGAP